MQIGMNLLLWTTQVSPDHYPLLDKIKEWGFDGAEVPIFNVDSDQYRQLGNQLDAAGLRRTAVTIVTPETNPISESSSVRSRAVDHLKGVVEMCHVSGVEVLCGPFHSPVGTLVGRGPTRDEWAWGMDVLRQVADTAQQAGVQLALEYLNRFECYFLNCAEDTVRFIKEANHPSLGMMYDSFHANIEEKNVSQAIRSCAEQTVHVHISENDRSTPGEGNVSWSETFSTLKEVQYDAWFVIEAFGQAMPDLAAATCIWRRMFPDETYLATQGLQFIKERLHNTEVK